MKKACTFIFILTLLAGCELYKQDNYQEYYVVESYLIANNVLPELRLSTTAPVDAEY